MKCIPPCAALLLICMTPAPASSQTHPFSVHDMLAMQRISDPQASPDGSLVVFTLRTTDLEANRGRTDLWIVNTDGTGLRRLTSHEAGDHTPRFAPDGRTIYFLSSRSGSSQVWKIHTDGGEAVQVTDLPLDVGALAVSPTGDDLAVAMDVFIDEPTPKATRQRLDEIESGKSTGMLYDRLFVRHWDTWKDGRRSHLFVVPVGGGQAVDIMRGMDADCPTKPFGGPEDFTFTPDGTGIVFTARDAGRTEAWSTNFDLYLASTDGSGSPRNLTADNPAWDAQPAFSPDGRYFAYTAMSRAGYESDRRKIMIMSWPDGQAKELAPDWDHSASGLAFSHDGSTLYTTADAVGQQPLYAFDVKSGNVDKIVAEGTVVSFAPAGNRVIYGMDNLSSPVELYAVNRDGSERRAITEINKERVAAARMGDYEQFSFNGWNDEKVHAYVVKPIDFEPARKYPVAFLIHGGPQGSFGNHFHYRWNPQVYAGAGYAAVMVDFHGSTGYGQAFCDSIRGDWGGKPLEDLQKGLAAALERYSWADGDRVVALGASYGGFMINWIAGNWPDRFLCLVNHDGNLDERMAYYDTEELWFPEWDHQGNPWDNPEHYARHNPIDHVKNWKTPMLVIHGALDYRVVDTQGLSTFTALQRRGIPSKLLYFPDENHWVLKPANSIQWHETVIEWIDQWAKK